MNTTPRQLTLEFDHRPALGREEFLVAEANAEAVAWIDRWDDWPGPAVVLFGPAGCGKTHLSQVFLAASGGRAIALDALRAEEPPRLLADVPAAALDDADAALEAGLEEAFLHLYNTARESGQRLLLTARMPPARWALGLADLASRLNAAPAVAIRPPDDALIGAVLIKLLADRQLRVDSEVVSYMLTRMERSFDAARRLVAAVDAAALAERRNITVPLVRGVLERLAARD